MAVQSDPPKGRSKRGRDASPPSSAKRTKTAAKAKKKCKHCGQHVEDNPNLEMFEGLAANNAYEEEEIALFDDKLLGKVLPVDGPDVRHEYKLSGFTFYDQDGHLVPFDRDVFDDRQKLVFGAGYIKPMLDDSPEDHGVPVTRLGPLNWWWIHGFMDGGEDSIMGVSTPFSHYYLMKPDQRYRERIFSRILEKAVLSKVVVETLNKAKDEDQELTFDDFLYAIESYPVPEGCPPLSHNSLLVHASFILAQVSFETQKFSSLIENF